MKLILLVLFSFNLLFAADLTSSQKNYIHELVLEIIERDFPELEDIKSVKIKTLKSDQYFFESNFGLDRIIFGKKNYKIRVSPRVFSDFMPEIAIKGILAHELEHTVDYEKNRIGGILSVGIKYICSVFSSKAVSRYEKEVDKRAIRRGYGEGLLQFRIWQKDHLTDKQYKKRLKRYLSPQEIIELMNEENI